MRRPWNHRVRVLVELAKREHDPRVEDLLLYRAGKIIAHASKRVRERAKRDYCRGKAE